MESKEKLDLLGKFVDFINNGVEKEKKCCYIFENSNSYLYFPAKKINSFKKNILIVIHELSQTGAPIVALDTAKVLKNNDYFVTVVSLKDGPLTCEMIKNNIPVIIMNKLQYTQFLNFDINEYDDVVDLDELFYSFDKNIFITLTLYNLIRRYMFSDKKIIWWVHEGWMSYDILKNKLPKYLSNNVKVYAGGEYARLQMKKYGYNYKSEILNYGVERIKINKNKPSNKFVTFMMAGTIGERKGQDILLKAIKLLPSSIRIQTKFFFVGDPYKGDLYGEKLKEDLIKYSNEQDNIFIYDSVSRDELYKLYCKIDVLVLASLDDPMPVVATENLMLGNIVLCSNNTGTSYYIKHRQNGFVFKTGDFEELSKCIEYIVKNKSKLDKIMKSGKKIYDDNFNMKNFKENLLKIVGDHDE